ncbi:hypothetical protein IY145_20575 [Methylosinus sp. H3A]|uniref:hypothetical protein n=1 Tax=Methylosinus sp. H3A TaxID=2785786 RepID=UPI0018C24404|nr:hypothetical protein [Methylosinus sp. H3A]MBG0811751.1 hypothetical protein [Methylosinus sp. H3A]
MGNWTVDIADAGGAASQAVVTGVEALFEGAPTPSNARGQAYLYIDEFAQLSSASTGFDLNAGSSDSTIDGRSLSIAVDAHVDGVHLGDGSGVVVGNSEGDIFSSGRGSDVFYDGSGQDSFVFHNDFYHDAIDGFGSNDTIQFDQSVFADWAHLLGATRQAGADKIITLDAADSPGRSRS